MKGGVSKKSGALLPERDSCKVLPALTEQHGFSLISANSG